MKTHCSLVNALGVNTCTIIHEYRKSGTLKTLIRLSDEPESRIYKTSGYGFDKKMENMKSFMSQKYPNETCSDIMMFLVEQGYIVIIFSVEE